MTPSLSLVSLTNIPTPYRTHLYNAMSRALREREIDLHVLYMAHTETGRYWQFDRENSQYAYSFMPGWHFKLGYYEFHINPSFVTRMWKNPPRWLLVSGSWFFPTVQAVPLAVQHAKTTTLFWNESNLAYMEQKSGLINTLRRRTLDYYDGFVVPGLWATEYVHQFAPSSNHKPFIKLPNVVNESLFRDRVAELRLNRSQLRQKWGCEAPDRLVILTVARLEPIKGVRELVNALRDFDGISRLTLLIAGAGALKEELEAAIREAGLQDHIRFLGYQSEANILELCALSDAFLLPSLGDPYPLVVIEAAFAALPLLLSDRVGCHVEALKPGVNGLLFDPYAPESIRESMRNFLELDAPARQKMGEQSLETAESIFSTRHVISNFIEDLVKV